MQHTFAHDAVLDQRISEGCEEALTVTQGHSRQTAQEFYVMRQMEKAADTASSTHKRLHGEVAVPKITLARGDDEEFQPSPGISPSSSNNLIVFLDDSDDDLLELIST